MPPSNPQHAALLAHVVSQTKSNIDFLVSQKYITADDARAFNMKLSNIAGGSNDISSLADQAQQLTLSAVRPVSPPKFVSPVRRVPPSAPKPGVRNRVKAIWDYNENNQVCSSRDTPPILFDHSSYVQEHNDLSFRAGDIIELVEETNSDWWVGRVNGRQGLFPSNYVERTNEEYSPSPTPIPPPSFPTPPAFPNYNTPQSPPPWQSVPPPQPYYQPPGGGEKNWVPPPNPPPPTVQNIQIVPAPQPEKKKGRFGNLGNTVSKGNFFSTIDV